MKNILFIPIGFIGLGLLMLFAGSAVSSAEEGVASSLGNFVQNKWVAFGLIAVGALWFAHDEGYLKLLSRRLGA